MLLVILMAIFCTASEASPCPSPYNTALPDAGGTYSICSMVNITGGKRIDCYLDANKDDATGDGGGLAYATQDPCVDVDYCVFGYDTFGNDFCFGASGSDIIEVVIHGTDYDDYVDLTWQTMPLTTAYPGTSIVIGRALGGLGGDEIYGSTESVFDNERDYLNGGPGIDHIYGRAGDDHIFGGPDYNYPFGNSGKDTIEGGDDGNYVNGGCNDDTIETGAGEDWIAGQRGMDTISSSSGNDSVCGDDEDDTINGGDGMDYLWGGDGDDDTINGGPGLDMCIGENLTSCASFLPARPSECPAIELVCD